jgi:hypothetical protein
MSRFAAVAAACGFVLAAACSDSHTIAGPLHSPIASPVVRVDTLRGMIRTNSEDAAPTTDIVLITEQGLEVQLVGPLAELLSAAQGRDLWVAGEWNTEGAMLVQSFAFRGPDDVCLVPSNNRLVVDDGNACEIGAATNRRP